MQLWQKNTQLNEDMKKLSRYEKLLTEKQRSNHEVWSKIDSKIGNEGIIKLSLRDFLIYWETLGEHIKTEYLRRVRPYKSKVGKKLVETIYFKGYPIIIDQ